MQIVVVIPNWNGLDHLDDCLASLKSQTLKHEVVIVDNGSVDGSQKFIKENYPYITLIERDKNYGFTGGVNPGIEEAIKQGADYVALFNNDAVADKEWLASLAEKVQSDPKIGIVTCKLMRLDKKHFDSTGDNYSVWGVPFPRGRNQPDKGQYDKAEEVFGASGGASLYRISMLKEIGMLDQRFFAYFEDIDISFRARLYGWSIWYEPKAIVYHHVSATSSKLGNFARYHSVKNFFLVYTKNMPGWLYWKYLPRFILQSFRWLASSMLKGHLWTFVKAYLKFLVYLPGVLKDRSKIQKNRKTSTKEMDNFLYHSRPPKIPPI